MLGREPTESIRCPRPEEGVLASHALSKESCERCGMPLGYRNVSHRLTDVEIRIPAFIISPAVDSGLRDDVAGAIDVMPTILDWLGEVVPRRCEGASLLPFLNGETPDNWRSAAHFEYDFRPYYAAAGTPPPLDLTIDQCGLSMIRDERFKYVHFDALPPLFFDLREDPNQFCNLADDPAYAGEVLDYAQKMLSWRIHHADRTLTGYSSSPQGLLTLA